MANFSAHNLIFPIEPYTVGGYRFGQRVRSRVFLLSRHLGDDILANPGTPVVAIGQGKVVWSEVRAGSPQKKNWGGLVVVEHHSQNFQFSIFNFQRFYSLYGHLTDLKVRVGDTVQARQALGVIAPGNSPENGWWKTPHLHFAIYTGPWHRQILPGYKRPFDGRTSLHFWQDPKPFIERYNDSIAQAGSAADTGG